MYRYILKRILLLFVIIICISLVVYTMMNWLSSGANQIEAVDGSGDLLDRFFLRYDIKDNFFSGYMRYAYNLFFKLDMGTSSSTGSSVWGDIALRLPKTLALAGGSLLLTALLGPLLGVIAAVYHNTWKDQALMAFITLGASFPTYVVGVFGLILFAVRLGWVSVLDYSSARQLLLPIIVLSLGGITSTAYMMRSNMLEILNKEYITAARARGATSREVLFKYALKNAAPTVVTVLATQLVQLLGGSFVVESVFPMAGMGNYLVDAILNRNANAIQSSIVVIGMMIAVIYMVADIVCAFINPHLRERLTAKQQSF